MERLQVVIILLDHSHFSSLPRPSPFPLLGGKKHGMEKNGEKGLTVGRYGSMWGIFSQ